MIKTHTARDGSVSYRLYGRADGVKKYVGTFPSERAAREAEQDHASTQRQIERGELPPEMDHSRTFREASNEWITALENRHSRSADIYRKRLDLDILNRRSCGCVSRT